MRRWAKAEQDRDPLVLCSLRLDEAIPLDHPVRVFDEILSARSISRPGKHRIATTARGAKPIAPGRPAARPSG